tara:strand:- start:1008 stop:2081 length:1074 start_codon:yes stop_codon:yes gene_type:complete
MKICLFSDLHAHPYSNGVVLEHGTNSRVLDAVGVINQVYGHARDIGAKWVLFGGDLFDRRKSIDVDTYNKIHETILSESRGGVKTVLLVGNHDQANRSGTIHALERFKSGKNCFVADQPKWWDLGEGVGLFTVPYYDDGEVIAEHASKGIDAKPDWVKHSMLLIHYGVQGAKVGPGDYIIPCELSIDMLRPTDWDVIFSGHYHIGQQIGSKFHYIGSAMQHRWDDVGFSKSFVVFDAVNNVVSREFCSAPEFMVIKDKLVDVDVNNKFVRIIRKNSLEEDEKNDIAESLKEDGALSVDFRFEPEEQVTSIERVELSENKGFYGIIEDYVGSDIVNTEGFDMDRLLSVGKDILSDVIE